MRVSMIVWCAALAGCAQSGPSDEPRVARASSAIQGGAEDDVHTFAVAVVDSDSVCSGTLVAPNLVLTARHCIADSGKSDAVDCARDKFSPASPASRYSISTDTRIGSKSPRYQVAKIFVPTSTKFCGNDLALLLLEENVPASEATPAAPALDPMTEHPRYGTTVAAIGYGISGPTRQDEGTRRVREDIPIQCTPGDPTKNCRLSDFDITATEFVAGDGLCSGDSGGSAFDQESFTRGKPVTFGVLSRAGETNQKCIDAIFTRTDAFAELLVETAKEAASAGGYPLPVWAGGTPADAGPGDAGVSPAAPSTGGARPSEGCGVARPSGSREGARGTSLGLALLASVAVAARRRRRA